MGRARPPLRRRGESKPETDSALGRGRLRTASPHSRRMGHLGFEAPVRRRRLGGGERGGFCGLFFLYKVMMNSLKRQAVTPPGSRAEIRLRRGREGRASTRSNPVFILNFDILLIIGFCINFFFYSIALKYFLFLIEFFGPTFLKSCI